MEVVASWLAISADTFIDQPDFNTGVQVGQFPQSMLQGLVAKVGIREDLRIRLEKHSCSRAIWSVVVTNFVKWLGNNATLEGDGVHDAILDDLDLGPFRQRIDALDADAVETARDLVNTGIEFSASMQFGHDDFDSRTTIDGRVVVLHRIQRHAATVITDRAGSIHPDPYDDASGVASHDLIDRVVNDLVDQVMQGVGARATNVHARSFTNGLKSFKDLNGIRGVFGGSRRR